MLGAGHHIVSYEVVELSQRPDVRNGRADRFRHLRNCVESKALSARNSFLKAEDGWRALCDAENGKPLGTRMGPELVAEIMHETFLIKSRKLASASWSLLALASSGAAPRHHVNIH